MPFKIKKTLVRPGGKKVTQLSRDPAMVAAIRRKRAGNEKFRFSGHKSEQQIERIGSGTPLSQGPKRRLRSNIRRMANAAARRL